MVLGKSIFMCFLGLVFMCAALPITAAKHKEKPTCDCKKTQNLDKQCVCHPDLNQQIPQLAKIVATKILNNIPLALSDFPLIGIQNLTPEQKEYFRQEETKALSCCLGSHVGWKLGLASATPQTPALGYPEPVYGELLEKMILVGNRAEIPSNYGLTCAIEPDLLFVVKSSKINKATTPQEVLRCLKGVYPAIEMAAIGTSTLTEATGPLAPTVPGQLNGQGVLEVTNIGARLWLRPKKYVKILGSCRSYEEWERVLNGELMASDELVLTTGPVVSGSAPPPAIPHLTNLLTLIRKVNENGHSIKKGDLLSAGNTIGLRVLSTANPPIFYSLSYGNLDPCHSEDIEMSLTFNPEGACFGSSCSGK